MRRVWWFLDLLTAAIIVFLALTITFVAMAFLTMTAHLRFGIPGLIAAFCLASVTGVLLNRWVTRVANHFARRAPQHVS